MQSTHYSSFATPAFLCFFLSYFLFEFHAQADFSALSEAHGAMKQKLEGAKARTAGLEMENGKMRKNMKQLLEKASGDDELVGEKNVE